MLALIQDTTILSQVRPEGWFTLPDGSIASPAQDGWTNGECRLATIAPADAVPEGKRVVSTSVELVDGEPKYVHELEDETAPPLPSIPTVVAGVYGVEVHEGYIGPIGAGAKISAGLYMDVGEYILFFDEDQPDENFFVRAWDAEAQLRCTYKDAWSIAISACDNAKNPVDPEFINVEIIRVI